MNWFESFRTAWRALRANKLRSFLTMLGIIVGVASVIDGDTIEIHGRRIRLHGFDAPESAQRCLDKDGAPWPCGQRASLALADKIGRRTVTCRPVDIDRWERLVARCFVGGEDLGAFMVAGGHAVAYRKYSERYVHHERAARRAGVGMWAGSFVMPWDWRRGKRIEPFQAPPDAPPGCPIKGNINSRGERLYHAPGGRWYEQVRIDRYRGERWFCTEDEATAAGWRRASE
jgi:endonuclease YncB( thermonuclease family)